MALIEEWEQTGQKLFRYRGQIPVLFLLIELVFLYFHPYRDDPAFYYRSLAYFLVTLLGFLIRIQSIGHAGERSSGRNRKQQVAEELNTSGWYSMVRHPLYLGNFLMWLGLGLYTESVWFILIFCLVYWLYYERIMFTEESFLRKKFGAQYLKWAENTPAFLPRFKNHRNPEHPFQTLRVLKSEYHMLLEVPGLFLVLDIVRNYNIYNAFHPDMLWVWLFAACALLWVILRIRFKMFRKH